MGHNPSRIGHFWPFCIFWGLGTSLRGSWARASEQNKMAEPNPQPVEVTDHDEGQEPQERQVINALSLTLPVNEKLVLMILAKIGILGLYTLRLQLPQMFLQQQESGNFQMIALTTLHRTKRGPFSVRLVVKKCQLRGQQSCVT